MASAGAQSPLNPPRGRGAPIQPPNRFEKLHIAEDLDLEPFPEDEPRQLQTQFFRDASRTLITYNDSPDIPFDASFNVYRGCEHGCPYCYARPTHEYLGFSAGLDFESRIMVKMDAPKLLRRELLSPKWKPQVLSMSGVTDCYQPVERRLRLTRQCLEVLAEFRNPVGIVTKNHLVTRDADILAELASYQAAAVYISITTLDSQLASKLEPRASLPSRRLEAIRVLSQAGVPVGVLTAPVIPGLNDHEIPSILAAAAEAGAKRAGYVVLRLPHAVKDVFGAWLDVHAPGSKEKVFGRVQAVRSGKMNDPRFGSRMHGEGFFAEQIAQLFEVAARRAGLNQTREDLSTAHFRRPEVAEQMEMVLE